MKKLSLLAIGLTAALATPAAFADDSATINVTATVQPFCSIFSATDADGQFAPQVSSTDFIGQIGVMCNLNQNYTITSPTVDSAGQFVMPGISGQPGASMNVVLMDNNSVALGSADSWSHTGTGMSQWIPFRLRYNPESIIPSVGSYATTLTFDLTAPLP